MKNIEFILIPVCLVLFLLLCSCSGEPVPEYDFYPQKVTLNEANNSFSLTDTMICTSCGNISFSFEDSIDNRDMLECISKTEAVYKYTGQSDSINICIFSKETYDGTYICDGTVYTYVQDWDSPEYIACVLLGIFGENCNYGAVYGYSRYISAAVNKYKLQTDTINLSDDFDSSFLDLNLLCFDGRYVSEEEHKEACNIAVQFVTGYIGSYGADAFRNILRASGNADTSAEFSKALSDFYLKNGIDYRPSDILYAYGGISFEYTVRSKYAGFYLEKNWSDENQELNPLVSPDFLHENYTEIKKFFEINTDQMERYQTLLDFEAYDNGLTVIFSNSNKHSQYSYYQENIHTIFLMNADSLMHEYIHSLTIGRYADKSNWIVEGFARYFSYLYDYYGIAMLNEDYNKTGNDIVQEYRRRIGRDIDMKEDFTEIENIMVYCRNYNDPNKNYLAGSSFVGYLASKFGERELIGMIFEEKSIGGELYSSLVKEWVSYIENNYSSFADYRN